MSTYEATFILDNREVKKGWKRVKGQVLELLEKHGCKPIAARRWDDRKLAYEIKKQKRATYFLTYIEVDDRNSLDELNKDLLLTDYMLRHLVLKVDKVPEEEIELTRKEDEELAREVETEEVASDEQVVVVREGAVARGNSEEAPAAETSEEPSAEHSPAEDPEPEAAPVADAPQEDSEQKPEESAETASDEESKTAVEGS